MSTRIPVTFAPGGLTVWVESGTTVLEAARRAGVLVPAPCGGRGVCGSCGVRVLAGALAAPDADERRGLARAPQGVRLACRARVAGPVELRPIIVHARPSVAGTAAFGATLVAGVDLGTTSVAAVIVDAVTGRELARASTPNRQQSFGADILSRLSAATSGASADLAALARESVAQALAAAASASGAVPAAIEHVVIAGNTAMSALLVEADAAPLTAYPFDAPALPAEVSAEALGLALAPGARVTIVPPVAGFVGGDALVALVSAGMYDTTVPTLLVDIGTNAEILLAGRGALRVASAAAGPAFEGMGITSGGPAADGAVERVLLGEDGSVGLSIIGGGEPAWLSGSGLVSAVAELWRKGHLDAEGLMHATGPLEPRFRVGAGGVVEVVLDDAGRIVLTQLDVRALQLAKAAVRVGIESVLRRATLDAEQLADVRVAGAFGSALDADDLADIGLVPDAVRSRIHRVGNAALDGAAVVALDPDVLEGASEMAAGAEHVDLASDPGFAAALIAATRLGPK